MANNQSVRRHLDAFTRGRIIGKLEEGRSVTSVAAEFELLTASFHDFGDNFKLQEQLSGVSVVVVHEEPPPQMTGTLSYRPEETGGRQRDKSLDTRHRRLDDRYRVLPWLEDCTVVVCLHDALCGVYLLRLPIGEGVLCGAGNTGIGETMNGDEYSLQMRADSV
ncbi:hypothetical protein TNCV_4977691 [Trichonephila clavipes]|nr:hypothetical protein TNCV_4977691 [Trichonephila clavipes]